MPPGQPAATKLPTMVGVSAQVPANLAINQIQFIGSHNSYKKAMSTPAFMALKLINPEAAAGLDYAHISLHEQLDLGIRKLELDVFYMPEDGHFAVGHVQQIDMNSHCTPLVECLRQIRRWRNMHPRHIPIWLSFNAKDQSIEGLPDPHPFSSTIFAKLDEVIERELGEYILRPSQVISESDKLSWPLLEQARGKFLLILDEGGQKREWYAEDWRSRPMFINVDVDHPAAAIMVVNDPIGDYQKIQSLVQQGFMVRTRADADTVEARSGATERRDMAFASGAQAVSTDYYQQQNKFATGYSVEIPGINQTVIDQTVSDQAITSPSVPGQLPAASVSSIAQSMVTAKPAARCNPVNTESKCWIAE